MSESGGKGELFLRKPNGRRILFPFFLGKKDEKEHGKSVLYRNNVFETPIVERGLDDCIYAIRLYVL